jgi:hypothetical protein
MGASCPPYPIRQPHPLVALTCETTTTDGSPRLERSLRPQLPLTAEGRLS